jgi:RNA recognition motif-containing protein
MSRPLAISPTLFIRNVPNNIPINDLRRELYYLFSSIAPVVEIQARKGKSRGKAWVSFPTKELAQVVQRQFDGFFFLGNKISIEFAKRQSKSLDDYFKMYKIRNTNKEKKEETKEKEPEEKIEPNCVKLTGFPPKINVKIIEIMCKKLTGFGQVQKCGDAFIAAFDSAENAKACAEQLNNYSFSGGHTIHAITA